MDNVDSCEETKEDQEYDNEKDIEDEKDMVMQRNKLQKQGNVILRRKSKGNPLYRKSKLFWMFRKHIKSNNIFKKPIFHRLISLDYSPLV